MPTPSFFESITPRDVATIRSIMDNGSYLQQLIVAHAVKMYAEKISQTPLREMPAAVNENLTAACSPYTWRESCTHISEKFARHSNASKTKV